MGGTEEKLPRQGDARSSPPITASSPTSSRSSRTCCCARRACSRPKARKSPAARCARVGQGGATFIYVLDPANREALIEKLADSFQGSGRRRASSSRRRIFAKYGLADPQKNPHMADLVLSAKSGYSFTDSLAGDLVVTPKTDDVKGTHGYDSNQPGMHATFVAWGAGIKAGAELGMIDNTSVAPTIAALLGVPMPSAEGKVLEEVLGSKGNKGAISRFPVCRKRRGDRRGSCRSACGLEF